ncbi:MAG: cytochrome c oxidase assembly protein [Devosiaceae bacterium]|nr:cytochrome c oxidase assembly protein [Devosiaceae bacterium MH13]
MASSPVSRPARTALALATFAGCMVGVAYAAVPLYELFCRVTGFGGTTQVADTAPVEALDQTIKVRFDANVAAGLDWDLDPVDTEIEVQIGAITETLYQAASLTGEDSWGTATFNVSPPQAGAYFNKMHCFCFELQHLAPGAVADMGVVFFVDPAILDDPSAARIDTITLSYTMFPADAPAGAELAANTTNPVGPQPVADTQN